MIFTRDAKRVELINLNEEHSFRLTRLVEFFAPHLLGEDFISRWLEVCLYHLSPIIFYDEQGNAKESEAHVSHMMLNVEDQLPVDYLWYHSTGQRLHHPTEMGLFNIFTNKLDGKLNVIMSNFENMIIFTEQPNDKAIDVKSASIQLEFYEIVSSQLPESVKIISNINGVIELRLEGNYNIPEFVDFINVESK